jgi:hypothetical protein
VAVGSRERGGVGTDAVVELVDGVRERGTESCGRRDGGEVMALV